MFIPTILGKNKRGFSLIEVVVSISIFMILSFSIYNTKLSYIKLKQQSDNRKRAVDTMNTLEHICKYGTTYDDLYGMKDTTMYINNSELDSYKIFSEGLNILTRNQDGSFPYMRIEIVEKNYLEVKCVFYYNKDGNIYYDFVRGKFDEE